MATQAEQFSQILANQTASNKRLEAMEGFIKTLRAPAAAKGITPQELWARATNKGAYPAVLGGDGQLMPFPRYDPRGKRIGTVVDPSTGKEHNFGQFLKHAHDFRTGGFGNTKSVQALSDYGVEVMQNGNGDGPIIKTALAESSGVTGGYTVPQIFSEQLQLLTIEEQFVEPLATKIPMTSRTLLVPSLDQVTTNGAGNSNILSGVQASFEGEAQTFNEVEPLFRQTELTAWQLSFYTVCSINLMNDQAVGLDSLLTQLFGWAIGWYKEYAFLRGNGVAQPMGILNAAATLQVGRQSPGKFGWVDAAQMLSHVYHMLQADKLVWVIHPSVIPYLITMTDASGRPVFIPLDQGMQEGVKRPKGLGSFGRLLGYDVMVSEKMPSLGNVGDVMLIDPSKYLIGNRMEMEIDLSNQVKFLNYQLVWRIICRFDGQPWLQGPVTLADGTYQVSPFCALK